jgi:hypothetical protein
MHTPYWHLWSFSVGEGGGEEYIELLKKLGMRKQMEVQKHPQTWVDFMDEL